MVARKRLKIPSVSREIPSKRKIISFMISTVQSSYVIEYQYVLIQEIARKGLKIPSDYIEFPCVALEKQVRRLRTINALSCNWHVTERL